MMHIKGRLTASPGRVSSFDRPDSSDGPKLISYGLDGLLFVPSTDGPRARYPLFVMLHGATYCAHDAMLIVQSAAEKHGFMIFAPKSRGRTWDIIARRRFGPDVLAIEEAIERLPGDYPIDSANIAIGGFSDGASYALTLGMLNGDLFHTVLAFSPGFSVAEHVVGRPRIYISHGRRDPVLPYDRCGAALARTLGAVGLDVRFDPFEGGHEVPGAQVEAATDWWLRN